MPPAVDLLALDDGRFVSPSTFRRSGQEVAMAVRVAREGTSPVVTTGADAGPVGG